DYVPKEQHDVMRESLRKVFKTGKPDSFEVSSNIPKIGTIWFSAKVVPIRHDKESPSVVIITTDITERKKAERAILESQERFERLFTGNPEAAVCVDSAFHILDANPRFEALFGYSMDEIKGKYINDILVPEDKMEEAEMLNRKAKKGYVYFDSVRKRKDGSLVQVSIAAAPVVVEGQRLEHVAVYKDISQLKRAEKALQESLEKLGVVGKLTRHDARNKLSVVTMNVFLAKQKLAESHEALKHLDEIGLAVKQVEGIFNFASIYEKLGAEELVYIDVGKTVDEAVSLFSDLSGVEVTNDCRGLMVLADSLLRQLFYNLVDNSLKHGERVSRIRMYYEEGKDDLKLIYEDDGVGISKAEKEKIFKEDLGKGTGHGLYLMRKMCEVYDWGIRETGKQGKGAQITITMPRVGESGKANYNIH
ncbi:MAG: PAS domain-containing sensor histidine kinase, partial [Candidatus Bathyarchaeota archaeon]|nr:PAS domain-containing sensor histidine kinase [Candidatus Bathyarchaeota archaeon]